MHWVGRVGSGSEGSPDETQGEGNWKLNGIGRLVDTRGSGLFFSVLGVGGGIADVSGRLWHLKHLSFC